jgi:acyl-CoA thioesterase FadM
VVRSVELEVLAPILMGQTLRVSTAVIGHRRIWARRLSGVTLADGTTAARVVTDWVLLDERGRVVRIPADFGLSFTNPELDADILRVDASVTADAPEALRLRVRPSDLDPMGHVNNAVYVDWLEEALASTERPGDVRVPEAAPTRSGNVGTSEAAPPRPSAVGVPQVAPDALPRRARLEYLASAEPSDEVVVDLRREDGRWASAIRRAGDGADLLRAQGSIG